MLKLVCFDYSKTLVNQSTYVEGAYLMGRTVDAEAIDFKFQRGELGLQEALIAQFGLWQGMTLEQSYQLLSEDIFLPGALDCVSYLKKRGVLLALVSNMPLFLGDELQRRYGFDYVSGAECAVVEGIVQGTIENLATDKAGFVWDLIVELELESDAVVAIADDSRADTGMFAEVGISIAFGADEQLRAVSTHAADDYDQVVKILAENLD